MVNKVASTRSRKERVNQEYTQTLNASIVESRRQNPMWTLQTIANLVGVSRERVRQVLNQKRMPTAAVKEIPVVVLTCEWCAVQFERSIRVHQRRLKLGTKKTYCGSKCQQAGLGAWHHKKSLARTECVKGHPLTPSNLYIVKTRSKKDGKVSRGRRCRACRSIYSREYYARRQQKEQEERGQEVLQSLSAAMDEVVAESRLERQEEGR
jgi:transcriptional regulator with XRE-family HTH domain